MAVTARRRFGLGWDPDLPDHRDLVYSAPLARLRQLPPSIDLRSQIPWPPYDQGPIGSCTANAIAGAIQFDRYKLRQIKGCLADGFPFVFGFSVYDSLYDAAGNPVTVLPMPSGTDNLLGGHAVLAVGYDDAKRLFTIRNSWGPNVQDHGYFHMPYS